MKFFTDGGMSVAQETLDEKEKFESEVQNELAYLKADKEFRDTLYKGHQKALAEIYRSPGDRLTIQDLLENERQRYQHQLANHLQFGTGWRSLFTSDLTTRAQKRARAIFEQSDDFFYQDDTP